MLCGRGDGGVTGAWRQGQDCSLAGGAADRDVFRAGVVGGEVLWRFGGERMGEEYVRGRNMFGVAGRMVGKDGDVVRAGCVKGGGGAGDWGGGR